MHGYGTRARFKTRCRADDTSSGFLGPVVERHAGLEACLERLRREMRLHCCFLVSYELA